MCWFQTQVFGSAILLRSGCRVLVGVWLTGALLDGGLRARYRHASNLTPRELLAYMSHHPSSFGCWVWALVERACTIFGNSTSSYSSHTLVFFINASALRSGLEKKTDLLR